MTIYRLWPYLRKHLHHFSRNDGDVIMIVMIKKNSTKNVLMTDTLPGSVREYFHASEVQVAEPVCQFISNQRD